jgi:hypothetical protein
MFWILRLYFLTWLGRDVRGVFRFWNGRHWVGIDPIPAARVLFTHPDFSWEQTPKLIEDDDPVEAAEGIRICAEAAREAFGIKPYLEGGLTEAECCTVLWGFRDYLGELKKNGSGPQTSPEPTGATSSEESPTNAASASGSTGNESDSSGPGTPGRERSSHPASE